MTSEVTPPSAWQGGITSTRNFKGNDCLELNIEFGLELNSLVNAKVGVKSTAKQFNGHPRRISSGRKF